jgi:chromosome segregation ATPase
MSVRTASDVETQGSGTDFVSLEEKIYRTIEMLKSAREAKANAERDVVRLRETLENREEEMESLKSELIELKRDREEVKSRVEKMLSQIDTLVAEGE